MSTQSQQDAMAGRIVPHTYAISPKAQNQSRYVVQGPSQHLVEGGQDPFLGGNVTAAECAVGNTPEHKERADGHQVHQVPKCSEQCDDGCAKHSAVLVLLS
jgi:hypothetical protein